MRILCLTSNSSEEASMRFRIAQFIPRLERAGHSVTVSTFFDSNRTWLGRATMGVATRLVDAFRSRQFDRLLVHREVMPLGLNDFVRLLPRSVPLIFDFDDPVFLSRHTGWRRHVARAES